MVTEYEQLLTEMLKEKNAKLSQLKAAGGKKEKQIEAVMSEIGFIQVELDRYKRGMTLFRSKDIPKVGRWGKPGATGEGGAESQ